MPGGASPRIFVAGHRGMVGSAIVRLLRSRGDATPIVRDRAALNLTDQASVRAFLADERPDAVILAAARVGGIHANDSRPAEFIADNLSIQLNVTDAAYRAGVRRLLFLGSSCIYPRLAAQPMAEDALLTGPLEPTNEPYAVAKIAGIKLCESYNRQYGTDYRSVMPTNLYGPGDNFHPDDSHVLPALIRRFDDAVRSGAGEVAIWGSGTPRREFLHVDDMAEASLFVHDLPPAAYQAATEPMRSYLNVGSGQDIAIAELARMVADTVGFAGDIVFDPSRPDGAPRKLLEVSRLAQLGWRARIELRDGVAATYRWYLDHRTGS